MGYIIESDNLYNILDGKRRPVSYSKTTDRLDADCDGVIHRKLELGGETFKLNYTEFNVSLFDINADGTDETVKIQLAIRTAQSLNIDSLIFNDGNYIISSALLIGKRAISFKGKGMSSTSITVPSDNPTILNAVFDFEDEFQNTGFAFSDMRIICNGKAKYGVRSSKLDHALFSRFRVHSSTTAGLYMGYGWCNDVDHCQFDNGSKDGIVLGEEVSNNAVNITNTKILSNNGIGIVINSGKTINIRGNTIEGNKVCGVYHRYGASGLNIKDNYFEANGITGKVFNDPSLTIKADIIINGNALAPSVEPNDDAKRTYPAKGVTIEGNTTNGATKDYFVYAFALEGCEINKNTCNESAPVILFGTYAKRTNSNPYNVTVGKLNSGFTSNLSFNTTDYHSLRLSSWTIAGVKPVNYFPLSFQDWTKKTEVGTHRSTIQKSTSVAYDDGSEAYEFTGKDVMVFTLDLSGAHKALAGKNVYFGMWAKHPVTTSSIRLWLGVNKHTEGYVSSTDWLWQEYQATLPASGNFEIGLSAISSITLDDSNPIYLSKIKLAIVGAGVEDIDNSPEPELTKRGTETKTGDGVTTSFTIAHGLGSTPRHFNVQAASAGAKGISYVTASKTNITVFYDVAPLDAESIIFNWEAKL